MGKRLAYKTPRQEVVVYNIIHQNDYYIETKQVPIREANPHSFMTEKEWKTICTKSSYQYCGYNSRVNVTKMKKALAAIVNEVSATKLPLKTDNEELIDTFNRTGWYISDIIPNNGVGRRGSTFYLASKKKRVKKKANRNDWYSIKSVATDAVKEKYGVGELFGFSRGYDKAKVVRVMKKLLTWKEMNDILTKENKHSESINKKATGTWKAKVHDIEWIHNIWKDPALATPLPN